MSSKNRDQKQKKAAVFRMFGLGLVGVTLWHQHSYLYSGEKKASDFVNSSRTQAVRFTQPTTMTERDVLLDPILKDEPPVGLVTSNNKSVLATNRDLKALKDFYQEIVERSVILNNWEMGCADLPLLAPYIRAIMDRKRTLLKKRQLVFDIGANNGQDADAIMGSFHKTRGMCANYAVPFTVISIEPSPQVFCELEQLVQEKGWAPPAQEIIRLNIGMSNRIGSLQFYDPGNEGGKLIIAAVEASNSNSSSSDNNGDKKMTSLEFTQATRCTYTGDHEVHSNRTTTVPTYTMDSLVLSLESLLKVSPLDEILLLKIDTEGHDEFVIQGANNLLAHKRITFVLFEVWNNFHLRNIVAFMDTHDYLCFLISPQILIPVHLDDWWYEHLNKNGGRNSWWGNAICGIRNSSSLSMLFNMFHSDNNFLLNAHDYVMNRTATTTTIIT